MDPQRARFIPESMMRERIKRLAEDLDNLSSAIREELDWRDKLYPIADDDEDEGAE
jgi:hypothetical protein